jgi:small GTP-binding protein
MSIISHKLCLVGDFGVGKTSLVRRFVDGEFSDKYLSTVGVKISRKSLELDHINSNNIKKMQVIIWDIEGSNKFKAIAPSYFQGAKGAIIVADVTRQETLYHLSDHIENFLSVNPHSYIVIALNKSDLIDTEYLEDLLKLYSFNQKVDVIATYLTSAKTSDNVNHIFNQLAEKLATNHSQ